MRKLSIYLDTSVISYLRQQDAPDKMKDTLVFWDDIVSDKYLVYLSDITMQEVNRCCEPLHSELLAYLSAVQYNLIPLSKEIESLAQVIIDSGILKQKSYNDCLHIACAVINECDYIVSWNFNHMVNVRVINGVRAINVVNGYRPIEIVAPPMLKGSD